MSLKLPWVGKIIDCYDFSFLHAQNYESSYLYLCIWYKLIKMNKDDVNYMSIYRIWNDENHKDYGEIKETITGYLQLGKQGEPMRIFIEKDRNYIRFESGNDSLDTMKFSGRIEKNKLKLTYISYEEIVELEKECREIEAKRIREEKAFYT